ncbi:transcription factor gte4 [Phtheirospermum japonicum]|uniref:Transcription factor gte4 n=1 Tax=Phtheirospermum japonicum TaxID=374723 RepID=A0A830B2J8_9LAMI|nr:transcription factor gte4 [Phtheirospermum japonicum]
MDSGTLGDPCDDIITQARRRWTENSIVYTRRKKAPKPPTNNDTSAALTPSLNSSAVTAAANYAAAVRDSREDDSCAQEQEKDPNRAPEGSGSQTTELQNPDDSPLPTNEALQSAIEPQPPNIVENDLPNCREAADEDDNDDRESGSPQGNDTSIHANGFVKPLVISSVDDDRIRFNFSKATPKNDIKELKETLLCELDQVTRLFKQLEAKELRVVTYSNNNTQFVSQSSLSNGSNYISARSDLTDRRLVVRVNSQETRHVGLSRINSDMGSARNMEPRPYSRQLSVSVMENNNRANEFSEKEKRTPKANQFYRNSEFLLGKDRLPPESNKRLKTSNGRRQHSGETEFGFGFEKNRIQVFKNCSSLLQRLMKHKHSWVFNDPVDAKAMGLVDYHDIIKHPMDLGTIKTRLAQNWYKSPRDFAEDVRLVFRNAMTYNPKGQDVHIMAEQVSEIFEERWAIIESEFNSNWKHQMYHTPTSRRAPPQPQFGSAPSAAAGPISLYVPAAAPQMRAFDSPQPVVTPMAVDPKIHRPHVGRTPVPRKPKARDPNKRDMTYEEKQRLSNNLQGLPSEKLDAIVQIIKKRNTALSQHDDEIEVDIDSVDAETLWELDRFVTNYKKSLSKNKRKAELALQARTVANQNAALTNKVPAVADQIGIGVAVIHLAKARRGDIMEVGPAVQAVPAVILDHLQAIPTATVPLDQMQGIHLVKFAGISEENVHLLILCLRQK